MTHPGVRIRALREQAAWSPQDLADACDMRSAYLMDIEDGLPKVHTYTYRKIADALGVSLSYLLGEEEIGPVGAKDNLFSEIDPAYHRIIKATVALIVIFGTLNLILGIMCVFGYLALWGATLLPLK